MTWIGKILTFVVMIMAVVWMYFTTQAFVTRSNWKTRADEYKAAYEKAVAARESEFRRNQASEASLKSMLATEQTRSSGLDKAVKDVSNAAAKVDADFKKLQDSYAKGDVDTKILQANLDSTGSELKTVRTRNETLEGERVALVLAAENAKKEEVKAKNAARLALAIADDNSKKVEELVAKLNEARLSGGSGQATVIRNIEKPPPPVLANLRGEVLDVSGELLTVSVGIDAGMAVGTVLDIYRTAGGGKYLGTVKVTSALNLFPKQAIVTFTPANRNIPFDRLPVGDLPKKGDLVQAPNATTGGR